MIRSLLQRSKDSSVLVGVKNTVVLLLWIPVIALMWGLGIGAGVGIGFFLYRFGRYGDLSMVSSALSGIDTTGSIMIVGAVLGGIGFLYLVLTNVTLGRENVNESIEQSDEIADNANKLQ
jgi:hypothetical protein